MKLALVGQQLHHVFETRDVVDQVISESDFQLARLVEDFGVY